jgi:hypothetical protein
MPFAYATARPNIRQIILERVKAGERLKAFCGRDGMPSYVAVYLWRRADAEFGAAMKAAMESAAWRRRFTFDEAKAREIARRRMEGESLHAILREPGMPGRAAFRHWVMADLELAEAMHRVRQVRQEERVGRCLRRRRPFDPVIADRIHARVMMGASLQQLLSSDAAFPCAPVFARWRRENPEFGRVFRQVLRLAQAHRRRHCLYRPALVQKILQRIRAGETLARIGLDPDMPCRTTLYKWARTRPDFFGALNEARKARRYDLEEQIMMITDEMIAEGSPQSWSAGRRRLASLEGKLERLSRPRPRPPGMP